MNTNKRLIKQNLVLLVVIGLFLMQPLSTAHGFAEQKNDETSLSTSSLPDENLENFDATSYLGLDDQYPSTTDMDTILSDYNNSFGEVWDPWKTKAAIHAVATYEDWMALASGYLYDNQIHLYRWNAFTDTYDLVWEVGGGIFQSDVFTLEFADTNYNNLTEIVAGTSDGRIYVFEQRHIYDPFTNMENQFNLVWESPRLGRIFDLVIQDTDGDYKRDIIVGTGDTIRWYEYDDHSGYPFNPEHWIEFEEAFSYQLDDYVTSLAVADTNQNGLPDIVAGTRSGEIVILQNNGTVLDINGADFPYMQDDSYEFLWSSGNSIQRSITDMEQGDLDGDGYKEVIIAVQGQGAYILDRIDGIFGTYRIQRDYEGWESDPKGAYPLDQYVDWMTNSSSLLSVDGTWKDFTTDNFTYYGDANVYFDYNNGTTHPEPLDNQAASFPDIFPYRTGMAQEPDDYFTYFDATSRDAWAIVDFGLHEEAAGNGITTLWDLELNLGAGTPLLTSDFELWIGQDNTTMYKINSSEIQRINYLLGDDYYRVEVDVVLNELGWDYYRFLKINVTSNIMKVDAITTRYFNKPIYDAQSVAIGKLALKGETDSSTVGYIGTVNGAILAVYWNDTIQDYKVVWDSWVDERFKLDKNIFDLVNVKRGSTFPAWLDRSGKDFGIDLTSGVYTGEKVFTYDADNFYNYRDEQSIEFVFTTMSGGIYAYSQSSPDATPIYNPDLSNMLFDLDFYGALGLQPFSPDWPGDVRQWISDEMADGAKYFAASLVPMDYDLSFATEDPDNPYKNIESGYWLYLSSWDGQVDPETRAPGDVDVSVWYLFNFPNEGEAAYTCFPLARCAAFVPVFNNITETGAFIHKSLTTSELTGQMTGIFAQSQWVPKVNGYDAVGNKNADLIVTNGKVHLLETTSFANPTPFYGSPSDMFGDLSTIYRDGYFDTINENSKGRIWTNAEPVNFDTDDDMDLILGFARYDGVEIGDAKVSYGFTYWENDGTAEDPLWIEKKKAVTNNDPASNFRVERYTEPVLVFDEYDFGSDGFDSTYGYHPAYRTNKATRLFMFKPLDDTNLWNGIIKQFSADYNPPTSLMVATYPNALRVDINLAYFPGTRVNYGYHIFETWDNSDELKEWTLTVDTADLDQDGNKEVIVGDFNNNAYVFEHLTNNTFKRAFKTGDFNRTIKTDQSPYAHEEFDGIGGEFFRTIFEHAEFVIAGVDLNNNGLLEFIAATSGSIFIFESVFTPGGFVQQDTFKLVRVIDILGMSALVKQEQDDMAITAIATYDDFTRDGRGEILVAVNDALLIFEVEPDDGSNTYELTEIFFGTAGPLLGLYNLVGNHILRPDYQINTIVVDDLNQNGYVEVVLAGRDRRKAVPIQDGFVYIMEWTEGAFFEDPGTGAFFDTILYNPINEIKVDDQDYDGLRELYLGHENGIDIYEFDGAGTPHYRETITSNPHYQLPERSYNFAPALTHPSTGDLVYPVEVYEHDTVRQTDGYLGMAAIARYDMDSNNEFSYKVVYTWSEDDGKTWQPGEEIYTSGSYDVRAVTIGLNWISYPVIAYVTRASFVGGSDVQYFSAIQVATRNSANNYDIKNPVALDTIGLGYPLVYPKLYTLPSSETIYNGDIGLAYLSNRGTNASLITLGRYDYPSGNLVEQEVFDYANETLVDTHFAIKSWDIAQLDYDLTKADRRNYGIIFSGYMYNETLAYDLDLFYSEMYINQTAAYNFTRPTRTYFSGIRAERPSLIQERVSGNLMVTFEQPTLRPYGGLYAIWSSDAGLSWQGPYDMSHPLGLDPLGNGPAFLSKLVPISSASKQGYRVGFTSTYGSAYIENFVPFMPIVAPSTGHGYTMVYQIDYNIKVVLEPPADSLICSGGTYAKTRYQESSNTGYLKEGSSRLPGCQTYTVTVPVNQLVSATGYHSNFTWYKLGAVTDFDIGDSDQDGRREIFAASGKHAYLYEFSSNGATYIKHDEEWISREYFYSVSDVAIDDINGNGFHELVVSSERGTVNAYELLDQNVTKTTITLPTLVGKKPGTPLGEVDPFFYLGAEFTKRTDYILHEITGDLVDDIIVVDDYYVGAADTYQLRTNETFNEVEWELNVPEFGRYLEQYEIFDIDGDGDDELIVAFEKAIMSIDINTGTSEWNSTLLAGWDYFGRNFNLHMVKYNSTQGPLVVISQELRLESGGSFITYAGTYWIDGTGVEDGWAHLYEGYKPIAQYVADMDGDGRDNLVMLFRNTTFVMDHIITISDESLALNVESILPFFIPMTDIAVGEFDLGHSGDEMMIFLDFSLIGPLIGFDLSWFPTLYWTLALNSTGHLTLPSHGTFLGFNAYFGRTRNYFITDFTNDGIDDFVGQGRSGGLFSFAGGNSGSYLYQNTGKFQTQGVPYAKENTLIGDEFCGFQSFVTTLSGNSIGCYNRLDFSSDPELKWRTDPISFDVINELAVGDLDGDGREDDILVIGRNGFVYIYDNDFDQNSLEGQQNLALEFGDDNNRLTQVLPWILGLPAMVAIPVLVRYIKDVK